MSENVAVAAWLLGGLAVALIVAGALFKIGWNLF